MKRSYLHLLLIKGGAALLLFASQVVPAWCLSIDQFGDYSYINSILLVLSVVAVWGTDRYCLKNVSISRQSSNVKKTAGKRNSSGSRATGSARRLVSSSYALVVFNSVLLSAGLLCFLPAKMAGKYSLEIGLFATCVLFTRAVATLGSAITKGIDEVVISEFVFSIVRPLVFVVFASIGFLSLNAVSISGLFCILAISYLVSGCGSYLINSKLELKPSRPSCADIGRVYQAAFYFLLIGVGLPLMANINTIQLGNMRDSDEVALYSIAAKLVGLVLLGLVSANLMIAPKLAPLFEDKNMSGMRHLIRRNNLVVALITCVPVLLLVLFAQLFLDMFGPAYASAAPLLRVLMIGQAVSVFCGPVVLTSTMVGMQKQAAAIVLSCCVINWLICACLIPEFGAMGAVVASIVGNVLLNSLLALMIYLRIGLNVTMTNMIR